MSKRKINLFLLIAFAGISIHLQAQPFAKEIAAFKKQDSVSFPPHKAILFVGSSSFTMWKNVKDYFPQDTIINRGFGGSTLSDLIYHAENVILPYHPRQLIVYCGENDFAADTSLRPRQVAARFKKLFRRVRKKYKNLPIAYISIKPSPSRKQLQQKFLHTNRLINFFLSSKKQTAYINVYDAMLNGDGSIREDIFLQDQLHINEKGYNIWTPLIKEKLKQ